MLHCDGDDEWRVQQPYLEYAHVFHRRLPVGVVEVGHVVIVVDRVVQRERIGAKSPHA